MTQVPAASSSANPGNQRIGDDWARGKSWTSDVSMQFACFYCCTGTCRETLILHTIYWLKLSNA